MNRGVDLNIHIDKDPFYRLTLLALATIYRIIDIMKLLLAYGAKVDREDFHGRTALSWASEYCQFGPVEQLVEHGLNVHVEDADWSVSLLWLIGTGSGNSIDKIRKYLVVKGTKEELHYTCWDHLKYSN